MHTPTHFLEARTEVLEAFIHEHPFATIITMANDLEAEHVPVLLEKKSDSDRVLIAHVSRANSIWQKVRDGAEVLAIFQGAHHYVTPSWYPSKRTHGKVVPTWNYVVVHVRGRLTWHHDGRWIRALLNKTTDALERNRKVPWRVSDAPEDFVERQVRAVVGFQVSIDSMIGKWKLSQNRNDEDYAGVLAGLASEESADAAEMLKRMRREPDAGDGER